MLQPKTFYSLENRWTDDFSDAPDPFKDSPIFQPMTKDSLMMYARNMAYNNWICSFHTKAKDGTKTRTLHSKMFKWQAIQILSDKHSETTSKDWWKNYQDCLFRVFMQPETFYDVSTGEHKQWYLLSPEDCYLVNKNEIEKTDATLPPREWKGGEVFLSSDPRLRKARLVPVECCRHWRHETTAGVLPEGL